MRFLTRLNMPVVLATLSLLLASSAMVAADEIPEWPSEQEQQLKQTEDNLLNAQRARFRALFFSKDKKEAKRLDREFKDLQKERNQLLQAMGRR